MCWFLFEYVILTNLFILANYIAKKRKENVQQEEFLRIEFNLERTFPKKKSSKRDKTEKMRQNTQK